eukprot:TRINITY_DN3877_c0_g1_i1.p3 TRINITY_DN3877_c0_g1~~TRINITY_DN3877_c0_g1_i1.p3  ORF type:complete len:73 (+),score=12.73 TRINITY_DN3877_c0_g1_i1:274-492(+)
MEKLKTDLENPSPKAPTTSAVPPVAPQGASTMGINMGSSNSQPHGFSPMGYQNCAPVSGGYRNMVQPRWPLV